ncbi:hypothetical protein ABS764_03095 [Flavobacterium sp. ST-87]|uniref:DUF4476 domain-containing protein n=1 Tax=Flavobacterium plantiphilum TaxID=3163297 RepID=A0ABW8XPR1_9FLAO
MKKRLEADLISIAHRILQIKDKSDVNQLYLETQKLYEKLSVLKFVEENYSDAKPTIGNYSEIEKEVEGFYNKEASLPVETQIEMNESNLYPNTQTEEAVAENEEEITEPETSIEEEVTDEEIVAEEEENVDDEDEDDELVTVEETETEDNTIEFHESEPEMDEEDETDEEEKFTAAFELTEEAEDQQKDEQEEVKKPETVQISFEDLLGLNYNEPEFVKVDDVAVPAEEVFFEPVKTTETPVQKAVENTEKSTPKPTSLNDKFSKGKGIDIDLNDRIAFVKHLFGNSNEDYNRVMNQLITYDNFYETKSFIDEMVKPDYNNWEGKEEYEERFMEIIEKKFL